MTFPGAPPSGPRSHFSGGMSQHLLRGYFMRSAFLFSVPTSADVTSLSNAAYLQSFQPAMVYGPITDSLSFALRQRRRPILEGENPRSLVCSVEMSAHRVTSKHLPHIAARGEGQSLLRHITNVTEQNPQLVLCFWRVGGYYSVMWVVRLL